MCELQKGRHSYPFYGNVLEIEEYNIHFHEEQFNNIRQTSSKNIWPENQNRTIEGNTIKVVGRVCAKLNYKT